MQLQHLRPWGFEGAVNMLIRCQLIDDAAVCTKMLDAFSQHAAIRRRSGVSPAAFRAPRKFLEELRIPPIPAGPIFFCTRIPRASVGKPRSPVDEGMVAWPRTASAARGYPCESGELAPVSALPNWLGVT